MGIRSFFQMNTIFLYKMLPKAFDNKVKKKLEDNFQCFEHHSFLKIRQQFSKNKTSDYSFSQIRQISNFHHLYYF